ncbi:MAG TPA: toll/interleukin-1 receptor domain-containing protein [Thermoanaerobaculia bacterium]|nr:toll/interleukin-1 receptor domain-containing protein [Thermoanaerobaculia bacterium]
MAFRYQIVILDPGASGRGDRLRVTLRRRLEELGIDLATAVSFLDAATFDQRDPKSPVAGVYFGGPDQSAADTETVKQLLGLPAVVIPVVETLEGYSQLVPEPLLPINGCMAKPEDSGLESIAGLVLEALSLLRQSRRLFISYRRIESQGIALQLYTLFDERGFDVFLDTHGVRPGEPFQEVLWHRLADSDVVILLDSPEFLASQWTAKELAEASAMGIGILQLIWPRTSRARTTELALPHYLTPLDFVPPGSTGSQARLTYDTSQRVATEAESLRARSLQARYQALVRSFCEAAQHAGVEATVQPERFILTRKGKGERVAVIPAIGVPTALQVQETADLFDPAKRPDVARSFLIYDHVGIRDRWIAHLRWLDLHLPVKTFRASDAAEWLARL